MQCVGVACGVCVCGRGMGVACGMGVAWVCVVLAHAVCGNV